MKTRQECIDEIIDLVKQDCINNSDNVGYDMPDGKYHFYIYVNSYGGEWDENPKPEDIFYVFELNEIIDGCCEPYGVCEFVDHKEYDDIPKIVNFMLDKYSDKSANC